MKQHKNIHSSGSGFGNGGQCVCESCNTVTAHQRGIPCTEAICPSCGETMSRNEIVSNSRVTRDVPSKRVAIISEDECTGCTLCISACPFDAIYMENNKAIVDFDGCRGCMKCVPACPTGAIKRG